MRTHLDEVSPKQFYSIPRLECCCLLDGPLCQGRRMAEFYIARKRQEYGAHPWSHSTFISPAKPQLHYYRSNIPIIFYEQQIGSG
jgi:hypothetical protein